MIRPCGCCGCSVQSDAPSHMMTFCGKPMSESSIDWSLLCGRGSLRPTRRTLRRATSAIASDAVHRADAEEILRRAGAGSYWIG